MPTLMRAISKDIETTRLLGVRVDNIIALTFGIGSALAAASGIMSRLFESLQTSTLQNTVYGRPIIGFKETVRAVTADDLRAYVQRWYQPQNMNSRAGAQVPFSSINYGTDTSAEGRMVIKNLLRATKAGLGNGETSIFPVQIFKVKSGVNYNTEDPNYDLFKLAMQSGMRSTRPFSSLSRSRATLTRSSCIWVAASLAAAPRPTI